MKISEILNYVNTFEKNYFLRVIEQIISSKPKHSKKIEKILNQIDGQIKNADNLSVEGVFNLVVEEYQEMIQGEFFQASNQLDILIDILIRDGNSLMSREWLLHLYGKEVKKIKGKIKELSTVIASEDGGRIRDYKIYRSCVEIAYNNDALNNREKKVTSDEQSILNQLVDSLELSHEEVKLLNYSVVPLKIEDVDNLVGYLTKVGVAFYSKKNHQIYIPDEVVSALRSVRNREVPDKVFKRVLKKLKSSQINLVARKHNIPHKLDQELKIKEIISEGIGFSRVMLNSIHKEGTGKSDKKGVIVDLITKGLKIEERIPGASLEDKLSNLIAYFNRKEKEDSISISLHGFDKLLIDLDNTVKGFSKLIRAEFELQESVEAKAGTLLMHNLKPLDVLYTLTDEQLKGFCQQNEISTRGDEVQNILEDYRDVQNLYLENYIHISNRDLATLESNNIEIKEAELGIQYENLTKVIFEKMNLHVDDELRKEMNTAKDKIDILISLGDKEVIIVECKTKKDRKFNTYSSASRQIKAYKELAERNGYRVIKTFIVAPDFSDDFVNECGLDYDLNLSLITSTSLIDIYNAYQLSSLKEFPYKILLRDVLIDSSRVVRSIMK